MARPLRIEYPGAYYHVTSRGNERKTIFRDEREQVKFLYTIGTLLIRWTNSNGTGHPSRLEKVIPLRPGPHETKPVLQIHRAMGRVDSRSSQRLHSLGGVSEEPTAYGRELSPEGGRGKRSGEKRGALLSGLLRCGRKMQVIYSGRRGQVARYGCCGVQWPVIIAISSARQQKGSWQW
jgi:hypothetical protein